MSFALNTFSILILGLLLVVIYLVILYFQDRLDEVTSNEIGSMLFSASSLVIGIDLIYSTMLVLDVNLIERDKMYTIYGGIWAMYVSCVNLLKKVRKSKAKLAP